MFLKKSVHSSGESDLWGSGFLIMLLGLRNMIFSGSGK